MRKYKNCQKEELEEIHCNLCGKLLKVERGIVQEGVFSVDKVWGYFSAKDGEHHSFDLCESCYDKFIGEFSIAVAVTQEKELI